VPNLEDTIVAVSSPPGRSPRGLLRVAGPGVLPILGGLLEQPETTVDQLQAWPNPRRLVGCRLRLPLPGVPACSGGDCLSLPVLLVLFLGPRSYSGHDTVEIQCPGNPALLDHIIHRITELGARLAEPGEFTFRAFMAGKLDLTQAEGVAATIAATSDSQLQAATMLRQGKLGHFATELSQDLAHQLALVEAGIDFTDQEDVVPITPGQLDQNIADLVSRLETLLAQSRPWGTIEALPRVVLAGPPSCGKSTLFNALLNKKRAVVSPAAHTTRDVLAEPWVLDMPHSRKSEVMLIDIAGLDTPHHALDHQAQAAARRAIDQADLLLLVTDDPTRTWDLATSCPTLRVRTKADLIDQYEDNSIRAGDFDIAVSALTRTGLDDLRYKIAEQLGNCHTSITGQMLALQPRHESALRGAQEHLHATRRLLVQDGQRTSAISGAELVAASLRQGLDELGDLTGKMTPDDILGRVFSTFCIGK